MPRAQINLVKGDKIGSETDYRDYLPVNMSGVIRPILGAAGYMLEQPGLTQYGTGFGVDRGGLWNERFSEHYRLSGEKFISVGADGSTVELGAVFGSDTCSLPYSFNTQGIVANGQFYLYDPTNGFRQVLDSDLGNPIDAVWVNGYYFFTDGEFLYHTDITDESSISPLKFATAEFMPDPSLAVAKTSDNKVAVFGRYSIEYFIDAAQSNFAFRRVQERAKKIGIVGTHCKCEMLDQFFIMGGRKEENISIHVVGVGSITNIASREVDKIIGKYTEQELSTSVLEARVEDDYHYLIVHLPNETLLYNVEMGQAVGPEQAWSILKTDVAGDLQWRAKHGVFEPRKGVWVYGDKRDSTLGILDETVATHYGDIVEWLIYTPFTYLETASIDDLEIEVMPGHTVTDDAGVFVSMTFNGVTHSNEYVMQYGKPGEYGKRFIRYRFGYVSDWFAFKLRGASRSRMAFAKASIGYG